MEEEERSILEVFCEANGIEVTDSIEDDVVGLDLEGVSEIWILHLGEGQMEVMARIEGLDANDPGTLRLLLEANYLGMATDEARLSVDPMQDHVILSERWPYQRLLAEDALEDLARFARLVGAWRSEGVATIQAKVRGEDDQDEDPDNAAIFRL
jgi:hypothetical protein